MENTYKKTEKTTKRKAKKTLASGGFSLSAFYVIEQLPYIFFVGFLGLIYIANSHSTVAKVKQINALKYDIEKLSWQCNSLKSEIMFESMESEIAKKVNKVGLLPKDVHVRKIQVESDL